MDVVGIIGGIGPESTIEYYRLIVSAYLERAGDGSYPRIADGAGEVGTPKGPAA